MRTVALVLGIAFATPAAAQHAEANMSAVPADSVPLYDSLGTQSRAVTTSSVLAQRYFDQGLRLTYGFGHGEAVRSFRAAVALDPECAMCWWGIAWARGPYINAEMDSTGGVEAYDAIQNALRRTRTATAEERALIEAMAVRYVRRPTEANRPGLDSAYEDGHARHHLLLGQAPIEAQQLPGVEVGAHHEKVDLLGVGRRVELELGTDPVPVRVLAAARDQVGDGVGVLLRKEHQHQPTVGLVVVA